MTIGDFQATLPPPMLVMDREVEAKDFGRYDSQGRYCAPETEISLRALRDNITAISSHQSAQHYELERMKWAIDGKLKIMEEIITRLDAFNEWCYRTYPEIVQEYAVVQKTKPRIGAGVS